MRPSKNLQLGTRVIRLSNNREIFFFIRYQLLTLSPPVTTFVMLMFLGSLYCNYMDPDQTANRVHSVCFDDKIWSKSKDVITDTGEFAAPESKFLDMLGLRQDLITDTGEFAAPESKIVDMLGLRQYLITDTGEFADPESKILDMLGLGQDLITDTGEFASLEHLGQDCVTDNGEFATHESKILDMLGFGQDLITDTGEFATFEHLNKLP